MTKEEILSFIDDVISQVIVSQFSFAYFKVSEVRNTDFHLQFMKSAQTITFSKIDHSDSIFHIAQELDKFNDNTLNNFKITKISIFSAFGLIHDMIKHNGFDNQTPEFEFFRHIRNAFSHGNRFNLLNGEPRRPASFNNLSIDASLHGRQDVLISFIGLGDAMDLLVFIRNYIMQNN